MSSCTSRLSQALHTPGLCVFAFITILTAMSRSALLSTYVWQFPVPVSITGTVLFCTTDCISPAPPLGISTSIYPLSLIISVAVSLLVSSTICTQSFGSPICSRAFLNIFTIVVFELNASFPPLSIVALPAFRHKPKASAVTFGLASNIIPITPIGTLFCPIFRPLSRVFI